MSLYGVNNDQSTGAIGYHVDLQDEILRRYTELQQFKQDGSTFRLYQKASVGVQGTFLKALSNIAKQ